jgi:hypothetical protein
MIKSSFIFISIVLLSTTGCKRKDAYRYPATEECNNLTLTINHLNPHERVYLLYDTRLLLRYRADSTHQTDFNKTFCNKYRKEGTFRLLVAADKKVILDTNLRIEKPAHGYKIALSREPLSLSMTADTVR